MGGCAHTVWVWVSRGLKLDYQSTGPVSATHSPWSRTLGVLKAGTLHFAMMGGAGGHRNAECVEATRVGPSDHGTAVRRHCRGMCVCSVCSCVDKVAH